MLNLLPAYGKESLDLGGTWIAAMLSDVLVFMQVTKSAHSSQTSKQPDRI